MDIRRELHWLPVNHRISYKLSLLTWKALHTAEPSYLSELLISPYAPTRTLRSANTGLMALPTGVTSHFSYLLMLAWSAARIARRATISSEWVLLIYLQMWRRRLSTIWSRSKSAENSTGRTKSPTISTALSPVWHYNWYYLQQHHHLLELCWCISQLPKLCVKISILRHRRMWLHSFSTRLTSVTFAEDEVLIFLILCKNAKIVQLWV